MRRGRQKYLEEAALREAQLLQELDRCRLLSGLSMPYIVMNINAWVVN